MAHGIEARRPGLPEAVESPESARAPRAGDSPKTGAAQHAPGDAPRAARTWAPRPGRRGRRAVATALAAAVVAGATACSAEPTDPSPSSPSPTTTAPTSAAPTPSRSAAPERPAAMERDDVEGAKAAAQYFLSLYPYAYNTGDLTEWKAMSHPECVFCASVIENVEALHAQGGYEIGGDLTFESVTGSDPVEGNEFFGVDVTLTQEPGVKYDASGSEVETFDGERAIAYFALAPSTEPSWSVREVTIEGLQ